MFQGNAQRKDKTPKAGELHRDRACTCGAPGRDGPGCLGWEPGWWRVLAKGGKGGDSTKKQRCIYGRCEALSSLCPSQISSHQAAICPLVKTPPHPGIPRAPGGDTYPGYGTEGLVHTPVPFAHGDITPFSGHCLLTAVEVCEEKGSGSAQTKGWNTFLIKAHRNTFYFTTSYTNPPNSQVSQRKYILTSVVLKRARHTTLSLFCNP